MKRFFVGWAFVTTLALGCVHQKVSLIRLGYQVERSTHLRDELLDQHRVLQYNVLTLRSPVILQERLAQRNVYLTPPQTVEVVMTPLPANSPKFSVERIKGAGVAVWEEALRFAASWLGVGRPAVAEPVRE